MNKDADKTKEQLLAELEELRKKSKERLDLAMMIKNEGIWDWNLVTNHVDFDERYYTMAGYDPGDFANNLKEFQKRVHSEDVDCVMSTAEQYLAGQIEQFQVEFRFKRKDDSWMWILGRGQIVEQDEKGIPLRFIGTHSDITERKQAEVDMIKQKVLFEAIFNCIPDAIVYTNVNREIIGINYSFTSIFGFTFDDLTGKKTSYFYENHEEFEKQGMIRFNLSIEEQALPYEVKYKKKDGSIFPGETLGTKIKDLNGTAIGFVGVIRDITERK